MSRHDRLATLVLSAAAKAEWACVSEPAIPTTACLRRPDLIFHYSDRSTYLLDVTMVADNALFPDTHMRKVLYYDVPEIRNWVVYNINGNAMHVSIVIRNWRGLMACASAEALRCVTLGLGRQTLSCLSDVTCERSLWIWQHFHRGLQNDWRTHATNTLLSRLAFWR